MTEPKTSGNQLESTEDSMTNKCGGKDVNHRKNAVSTEQILQAIIRKAIEMIFRTDERIEQEVQILLDLECIITAHELNLTVMPFGSSTYGLGGPDTDFNICLLTKNGEWFIFHSYRIGDCDFWIEISGDPRRNVIETVFDSFVKSFEMSTKFIVTASIAHHSAIKYRLHAIHNASGILCTIQIDVNANKIESSQLIRNCLLHSPICKYCLPITFRFVHTTFL